MKVELIVIFSAVSLSLACVLLLGIAAPGFTGLVAHDTYDGFAQPAPGYALSSSGFTFSDETDTCPMIISADDFAVYRYAYVSFDGGKTSRAGRSGVIG